MKKTLLDAGSSGMSNSPRMWIESTFRRRCCPDPVEWMYEHLENALPAVSPLVEAREEQLSAECQST